jgi:hypothetical protein
MEEAIRHSDIPECMRKKVDNYLLGAYRRQPVEKETIAHHAAENENAASLALMYLQSS